MGEYLDNELADDEQDAKKMKKAEKEAQRKIAESRAVKAVKARAWYKTSRAPGATATSPSPSPLALSTGSLPSRFYPSVGSTRSIGSFTFTIGTAKKRGTCFSCGKPGHWRNECPVLVTGQTHQEGRKLSDTFSDLCVMDSMSGGFDFSESVDNTDITPLGQGDILERECSQESVRGRLKSHISAWEEIGSPDSALAVIKEGYKLPLLTIPESRIVANNKSTMDSAKFVTEALEGLLATNCISVINTQPWVVNPLTVAVRVEGKKRLVLDLRHVNPHLFKYKFKCEDISTAQQLLGKVIICIHSILKVLITTLKFSRAIELTSDFNGRIRGNQHISFLTCNLSAYLLHPIFSLKF